MSIHCLPRLTSMFVLSDILRTAKGNFLSGFGLLFSFSRSIPVSIHTHNSYFILKILLYACGYSVTLRDGFAYFCHQQKMENLFLQQRRIACFSISCIHPPHMHSYISFYAIQKMFKNTFSFHVFHISFHGSIRICKRMKINPNADMEGKWKIEFGFSYIFYLSNSTTEYIFFFDFVFS